MKIVIAGSSGFVGSQLINLITQISDFDNPYELIAQLDVVNGVDVCDFAQLKNIPEFDCLVHLANLVYVPDSYKDPYKFYRINYLSTLNMLELCRKYNAHLIYISSYVYGQPQYLPVDEKHRLNPFNPYAQTKFICESLCQGYHRDFGVNVTILRPFNIYGKGQSGNLLIPEIANQIAQGKNIIKLKSSSPKRDFVNIRDVASAIVASFNDVPGCNAYNVCSNRSLSVREITEIINNNLKHKVIFEFSDSDRPNEVDETIGSYEKINKTLGWVPRVSFEEGIREIFG